MDSLLGVEVEVTLKRIAIQLVTNGKEPYSHTCGYVKSRVEITLVRVKHHCIRGGEGSGIPNHLETPQVGGQRRTTSIQVKRGDFAV